MNRKVELEAKDILSHLILKDHNSAMEIAGTPEWDGGKGVLNMDIKVNGITVDTEVFRKVMEDMWEQACNRADAFVDADKYNERVQAAAKKLVQDSADSILETMDDLRNKLEDVDNLIEWKWEQ